MPTQTQIRAGAAAVLLAAFALLVAGQLTPTGDGSKLYGKVQSVPGHPLSAGATCVQREGYGNEDLIRLHIPGYDAGTGSYAVVRVCAMPAAADAGVPEVPLAYEMLPASPVGVSAWDGGSPQVEVWLQGHPNAPFSCACAKDTACEMQLMDGGWSTAPKGLTLNAGQWRGTCVKKPCTEWGGSRSMPEECLP